MRGRGVLRASLVLALGCAEKAERPPVGVCVGKCSGTPGVGSGVSPEGGSGPVGEGGTSSGDSNVELTGNVLILNDDLNFKDSALFTDEADVKTEDANGKSVTGHWDGLYPFSIPDVPQAAVLWVLATPQSAVANDALPVVEPVRTDHPDAMGQVNVTLALVHTSSIEHVFDLASVPLTPDPSKGQIILLLKQRSTAADPPPVVGVSVTATTAEDVLYGASGGFSDVATETDDTGVVVLANVPAAAWPGALVNLTFSGARSSGSKVPAVSGAVTVATISP